MPFVFLCLEFAFAVGEAAAIPPLFLGADSFKELFGNDGEGGNGFSPSLSRSQGFLFFLFLRRRNECGLFCIPDCETHIYQRKKRSTQTPEGQTNLHLTENRSLNAAFRPGVICFLPSPNLCVKETQHISAQKPLLWTPIFATASSQSCRVVACKKPLPSPCCFVMLKPWGVADFCYA